MDVCGDAEGAFAPSFFISTPRNGLYPKTQEEPMGQQEIWLEGGKVTETRESSLSLKDAYRILLSSIDLLLHSCQDQPL